MVNQTNDSIVSETLVQDQDSVSITLPETVQGHLVFIPNEHVIDCGKIPRTFRGGDRFTQEILQALVFHGVKQKIGDAYSVAKGTDAEKMAKADRVWDSLLAGEFKSRRAENDPVMRHAFRLALKHLAKIVKGWEKMDYGARKDAADDFLDGDDPAAAKIMVKAEKIAAIEADDDDELEVELKD